MRAGWGGVALVLFGTALWAQAGPRDRMAPSVERRSEGGGRLTVASFGARVLDVAPWQAAGQGGLAVLLAAPSGERDQLGSLWFVPLDDGAGAPRELTSVMVPGLDSLARREGPSGPRLFAGHPNALYELRGEEVLQLISVAEGSGLDLDSVIAGRQARQLTGLPTARAGRAEWWNLTPEGLTRGGTWPLPTRAERSPSGLRITTPAVRWVAGPGDGWLVSGPADAGPRRLHTVSVELATGNRSESWSLLPGDEQLLDVTLEATAGRPVAIVSTLGKLSLLAKRQIRLLSLSADRTKQGHPPFFALETDCQVWHPLTAGLLDWDGDGARDLVLVHPAGLTGSDLAIALHPGRPSGGLTAQARKAEIDGEAIAWSFRHDATGDGRPDLVVLSFDKNTYELAAYASQPGGAPVKTRPAWKVRAQPSAAAPQPTRQVEVTVGAGGNEINRRLGSRLLSLPLDGHVSPAWVAITELGEGRWAVTVVRR